MWARAEVPLAGGGHAGIMLGPSVGSSSRRTPLLGCTDHSGGPPWASSTISPDWLVPSSASEAIPGQARPDVTSAALLLEEGPALILGVPLGTRRWQDTQW